MNTDYSKSKLEKLAKLNELAKIKDEGKLSEDLLSPNELEDVDGGCYTCSLYCSTNALGL